MHSSSSSSEASSSKTVAEKSAATAAAPQKDNWDPLAVDFAGLKPNPQAITRIKRDISELFNSPAPGICALPDENDITKLHALVTGPMDTPYEGGFFYFLLRCPPDYPAGPPRARIMTTGRGQTRFNPNLYKNGKVCLSIIGTWPGPGWSPVLSLGAVLISIQSLMNENPYYNEPGFEASKDSTAVQQYNNFVRHETLRIAVCDVLEGKESLPESFRELIEASFADFFPFYESQCKKYSFLNGQTMFDPFDNNDRKFDFNAIHERLRKLQGKLGL